MNTAEMTANFEAQNEIAKSLKSVLIRLMTAVSGLVRTVKLSSPHTSPSRERYSSGFIGHFFNSLNKPGITEYQAITDLKAAIVPIRRVR